jgi:hypothetical protein
MGVLYFSTLSIVYSFKQVSANSWQNTTADEQEYMYKSS